MARGSMQQRGRPGGQGGDLVRAGGMGLPSLDDFFRGFSLAPVLRDLEQAPRMRVDVEETDQAYILRADVPGADREDITVAIDGNTVSIRANVEEQKTDQQGNMLRAERIVGEEFRTFTLPQEVDDAKAEAKIENGVLVLTLPKKSGGGGKKLQIQ
jgi:HSP20 family protein